MFVAIWLLAIFGFAAIGVDGGTWYVQRRQQQNAADMAAFAGVDEIALGASKATIQGAGTLVASANGFSTKDGASVTINYPPASGPYAGNMDAVEAIITRPAPLMLSAWARALAGFTKPTVGTRAVALYSTTTSQGCILSRSGQITLGGNSTVSAPKCAMISNNAGTRSIDVSGTSVVTAKTFSASGFCYGCSKATLSTPYLMDQLTVTDPYAALQGISFPTVPMQTYSSKTSPQPGYYPKGIQITSGQTTSTSGTTSNGGGNGKGKGGGKTAGNGGGKGKGGGTSSGSVVTFAPGLYVIGAGGMQIDGGTVSCSACTFVFVNGGTVTMNGTATVNFTAKTDFMPPFQSLDGILFYGDGTSNAIINGGSSSTFTGAVYFPYANLELNGNETNTGNPATQCFMAVADSVTFLGGGATGINAAGCSSMGLPSFYTRYARLVQ